MRTRDVAVHVFDRHLGFPISGVFALTRGGDGRMWAGLDDGLVVDDGHGWRAVPVPQGGGPSQVRSLLALRDGTLWVGTRTAVLRLAGGRWTTFALGSTPLPVYSLVVSRAIDGTPRVVAGTIDGPWYLDGASFVPLALPDGMTRTGAMAVADAQPREAEALWVATLGGGVARLQDGRWRRWSVGEGLDSMVEHVVPGPADSPWRAVAATSRGAYVLPRDGGRWRMALPEPGGMMRVAVTRSALAEGSDYSLWGGAVTGELVRLAPDGRVDTVRVNAAGTRTPVMVLSPLAEEPGRATLYVGFRGGVLARVTQGPAATVLHPAFGRGMPTLAIAQHPRDGRVWVASQSGLIPVGAPDLPSLAIEGDAPVAWQLTAWPDAPGGPALLALTPRGVLRHDGREWRSVGVAPARELWALAVAASPATGVRTVVVGGREGAWYLERDRWVRWPGAPRVVRALLGGEEPGDRSLWAGTFGGTLHRWDGSAWRSFTERDGLPAALIQSVARVRRPDGGVELWVASDPAGLHIGSVDGRTPWRRARVDGLGIGLLHPQWIVQDRLGLAHVASTSGVVTLRPGARAGSDPEVLLTLTDEDGLPHPRAARLAATRDGRVWVATAAGIGVFDARAAVAPSSLPTLRVSLRTADGTAVAPGSRVNWEERNLDLDVVLDTRHREADTRYRVEVDGGGQYATPWQPEPTVSLRGLAAGSHAVRVWARDWRGRIVGPTTMTFAVRSPSWRSLPTLAAAATVVLALVVFGERARTGALRRRARESEANERRIAASEQRFRALFDRGADAQLLLRDTRVVAANDAAVALLAGGAGRSALIDRGVGELLGDDEPLAARDETASRELHARALDGTPIPVAARALRLQLDGEALVHVALHDLRAEQKLADERAALEEQLRRSQRLEALGTLASGVAHDFNNLLAIIRTNAELARDVAPSAPELDAILTASDRARDLVRQILAFGRRSRSTFVPLRPSRLLHDFFPMLRASIPTSVQLTLTDDAPDSVVLGDSTQLHQMLLNLCANAEYALRATGGGTIAIALDEMDHPSTGALVQHPTLPAARYLRMRVSDSGPGIDAETQRRIFEPFFSTKPAGEGTGLGLSVLHGLVESHGGSVGVRSVPGEGTLFEVLLPLMDARVPEPRPASQQPGAPARPSMGLVSRPPEPSAAMVALVVDDEPYVGRVAARALERIGIECVVVEHPREALAVLAQRADIGLLLTDLTMPELRGDDLAREAHALRAGLAVVIMTGLSAGLAPDGAAAAGVHAVVDKPFTTAELQRAVYAALAARDGVDLRTPAAPTATA